MVISEFTLKEILQVIWANTFHINTKKSKILQIILGILILLILIVFFLMYYNSREFVTLNKFSRIVFALLYTLYPLPMALFTVFLILSLIYKRKQIIFFEKTFSDNLSKIDTSTFRNSNIKIPYIKHAQENFIKAQFYDVGGIYNDIILVKKISKIPHLSSKNILYIKKKNLTPEQLSILKRHVKLWIG